MQKTKEELLLLNINRIYENTTNDITGEILQQHLEDIIDSMAITGLPSSLTNNLGEWDADTNTPTIVSSIGSNGDFYIVSVEGNTLINDIDDWNVDDYIWYDGSTETWQKISNSSGLSIPGGITGTVQFNNYGEFSGDDNFFWNNTTKKLGLGLYPSESIYPTPRERLHLLSGKIRIEDLKSKTLLGTDVYGNIIESTYNPTLITSITHSQLLTLKTNNLLTKGQKYVITDFKTKYNQVVTNTIKEASSFETIVLTATSINTFDIVVQSVEYPNDIIKYDITNILCEDGITNRKGKITYRKDTENNLEVDGYDFLQIYHARWETSTGSGLFTVLFDNGEAMQEFLTFGSGCYDISIGKHTNYNNIVFGNINHSITIGTDNYSMTFGSVNYSMIFGNTNYSMTFGSANNSITFRDKNNSISVGNANYSLTFGDANYSITFGSVNYSMTFGDGNDSLNFNDNNHSINFKNLNSSITFGDSNLKIEIGNSNNFSTLTLGVNSIALLQNSLYEKTLYTDNTDFVIRYIDNSDINFIDATT